MSTKFVFKVKISSSEYMNWNGINFSFLDYCYVTFLHLISLHCTQIDSNWIQQRRKWKKAKLEYESFDFTIWLVGNENLIEELSLNNN